MTERLDLRGDSANEEVLTVEESTVERDFFPEDGGLPRLLLLLREEDRLRCLDRARAGDFDFKENIF